MDSLGNIGLAIGLLYGGLWLMRELTPTPYRLVTRLLRRCGRRLWDVAYRIPATQRSKAFGLFWLGCILWTLSFIGVLTHHGRGLPVLLAFGLCLAGFRLLLGWWERRVAARVQRPLPRRERW